MAVTGWRTVSRERSKHTRPDDPDTRTLASGTAWSFRVTDTPCYLVDREYTDAAGRFRFVILEESLLALARFRGKGTVAGTRAFAEMLEESTQLLPPGRKVMAIADLSELYKTPMRAQFILGKWLLTRRSICGRIAVVGAAAWERKLATAVFKLARLSDIGFFATQGEAQRYMGIEVEMPEL